MTKETKPLVRPPQIFPLELGSSEELFHELLCELAVERDPLRNLGTFSTSLMDQEANHIITRCLKYNLIDNRAYPWIANCKNNLVNMIADLVNCADAIGEITSGSSEAVFVGLLAHKLRWIEQNGEPAQQLNFVAGSNIHSCFTKFAKISGVELRKVPLNHRLEMDMELVEMFIDENTFCIVGMAGSTEVGALDDLEKLDAIASKYSIPIHIDAAFGAFYFPFAEPEIIFDFRLKMVMSMNISGHKAGLVFPGIGIVLLRREAIPTALYNTISYLSSGALNHINLLCSQNAAFMVAWYYNIRKLGFNGYKAMTLRLNEMKEYLKMELEKNLDIKVISNSLLPIITFTSEGMNIDELSEELKKRNWIQNTYEVTGTKIKAIRIVIKNGMSYELLQELINDIKWFSSQMGNGKRIN